PGVLERAGGDGGARERGRDVEGEGPGQRVQKGSRTPAVLGEATVVVRRVEGAALRTEDDPADDRGAAAERLPVGTAQDAVPAGEVCVDAHRLAQTEVRDQFADFGDGPRDLVAGRDRERFGEPALAPDAPGRAQAR